MREHPTEIELELARTGEAGEAVAAHLETCGECRARLERIDALANRLGQALAAAPMPDERARVVVELARERAAAIRRAAKRRPRRTVRRLAWAAPLAAAAALALVLVVPKVTQLGTGVASRAAAPAGASDVNRDGRIDILDALALALEIESGRADASHDINRDGRLDRDDVDRIAMAAVAIDRTGGRG